jgi:NAD(P)H-flavin reductase
MAFAASGAVMAGMSTDPMLPVPCRVVRVRRETRDTWTLDVAPEDGGAPLAGAPGQFNMLYVFGVGEVPISISAIPSSSPRMGDGNISHAVRDVGAATRALTRLKKGDTLGLRGPFGSQWPVEDARSRDVVLVAGGIGLAPLRPVVHRVLAGRRDFGKVALLYGARTPAEVLYPRELARRWSRDIDIQVTVDRATGDWTGEVGVVTRLIRRADFDPRDCLAMVCGPEIMMRFTIAELQKLGVDDDRIFISMERNMKCAVGFCGHCQLGPAFICKDGPVFPYARMKDWLWRKEV